MNGNSRYGNKLINLIVSIGSIHTNEQIQYKNLWNSAPIATTTFVAGAEAKVDENCR